MKRGNVTPLYPSQSQHATALARRIGTDRQIWLDLLASWRRQQRMEIAARKVARRRAS